MRRYGWLFGLLLVAMPLMAQDLPPPLRDWKDWVLHDVPQHACPFLANQSPGDDAYQCTWPGRLTVDAAKDGARFSLDVHVDAADWVTLPGDEHSWPQQVTVNNKPLPVLDRDGEPALWLEPGDYTVHGNLPWNERPASVHVPSAIGLVTLSVDGVVVSRIERHGEDLTLGEAAATQRVADALSLRVYRRLSDDLPPGLETQLQLDVTGSAREQLLGPALPNGFVATSLTGDLPARLESDGRLRVQLRAGRWTLHLLARGTHTLQKIVLSPAQAPWPAQEIWSYADDPVLRTTRIDGRATDATQAGVPGEWTQLPAYALDSASGLDIEQTVRGGESERTDPIRARRDMWLDFDGRGLSVSDHLTGILRQKQRLDVGAPWLLQRATQNDQPLLITETDAGRSGVELRDSNLNLQAGLRIPDHGGALPSAGWRVSLEGIAGTLHLPYGYRLLGTTGVDKSPDSWVAQWTLLDLFVVALIALLAGRLLGWRWAILAAGFLVLSQHEDAVPRWTLGAALAFALLTRALPDGRLRLSARIGAGVMLALTLLWTLPFAATQMQYALHPQLENGRIDAAPMMSNAQSYGAPRDDAGVAAPAPVQERQEQANQAVAYAPTPPPAPVALSASIPRFQNAKSRRLATVSVTGSLMTPSQQVSDMVDSHSVVQAGNGTPSWDVGNNYRLAWSGPIAPDQQTRLIIAPAWLVRLLRVLMLALMIALIGRVSLDVFKPLRARLGKMGIGRTGAVLLLFALLPHLGHAQAIPNEGLLNQLRNRLTEAPKCAPHCAVVAAATIQANGDLIVLDMDTNVGATVALPLPQPSADLQWLDVSVDGHANASLGQLAGQPVLRLDSGVHHITLRYRANASDTASLQFVLRPQWMTFSGQDWSIDGVDQGRVLGDSVTLNRLHARADGKPAVAADQTFPPYVRLTRNLVFGLDWTVENTVERVAPRDGGFSLDLPLLPGEHPLGDNSRVHDGRIGVTFNAGDNEVHWTSRLDRASTLSLKAPALEERAEVWKLSAAPIWHLETKGVPISDSTDGLSYLPLPNESLELTVTQPKPVDGDSLAFDDVQLTSATGDRATETTLSLAARSTRGGEHVIVLPQGIELLSATRDGQSIDLALREGKLSLPLLPDQHRYELRLREAHGVAVTLNTASIDLGAPAANITLNLKLPQDRWVLWTWGPTSGPAVLYWSQLIVLLIAAWALARFAPVPLRFHQWLLLGLGFSAFAWSAYALVVLWLISLGLRGRHDSTRLGTRGFNAMQLGLAAITVVALLVLISAVPKGLLGQPDMHIEGNDSTAWNLSWFADQSHDALPRAGVLTVSLWVYKILMLAWALWLANALIGWLRWGFDAWTRGGYWRAREPKPVVPPKLPGSESERPHDV